MLVVLPRARMVDLVLTRFNEDVGWLTPYLRRPGWRVFLYNTGRHNLPAECGDAVVHCERIANAGYEWHGYLRHLVGRYDELAPTTIFMQGDPFTVSPDIHCLLNATSSYRPIQILSWVQMAKRKMPLFSECTASNIGACRVYVEPVTAGMRPMLHGDRWLHSACRMAKRMKGSLFQFLYSQLGGDPRANGPAVDHTGLITSTSVPPRLYRSYGAQFAATRGEFRRKPRAFYERLLLWLTTPHDDMKRAGFLNMWRGYTIKEKAILLEIIWMALLGAERHVPADVCASCLRLARTLPLPADAVGPSCSADYFSGGPRVEACNVTGDGWGGQQPCGNHCGRLDMHCPFTKNDAEVG